MSVRMKLTIHFVRERNYKVRKNMFDFFTVIMQILHINMATNRPIAEHGNEI